MINLRRRDILLGGTALLTSCAGWPGKSKAPDKSQDAEWEVAEDIAATVVPPEFPDRSFSIVDFGADPTASASSQAAIAKAVSACHNAGGGRVVVPAGDYLCGPIHLLSMVNLHLEKGARLRFSTAPEDYLPAVHTRWEGMELMGYSPLIYAYKQKNIAITGEGILDGQASDDNWWAWKGHKASPAGRPTQHEGRQKLMQNMVDNVPLAQRQYAKGYYFRPPFVQFYACQNIHLEGVHIRNSPFWLVHPVLCDNVLVRGLKLESMGPNSDGCDPESCRNVLIENCYFDTGDDCIAIKSGRNDDGRRFANPCERVLIRNCQMRAGHGGVVIGSEISGGVRHIFAENCVMSSPDLERGLRIKTNSVRGGLIEKIRFRDIQIGHVRDAIVINFYYEEGDAGQFDPTVRDIRMDNITCQQAQTAFLIRGFERAPIRDLQLNNVHFLQAGSPGVLEQVKDLSLNDVTINGVPFEN